LCQLLICFTVAVGLSSSHLEATAASQPFGTGRSMALAVAKPLHRLAEAGGLDRPDRALAQLLGREPDGPGPSPAGPIEAASPAAADSAPSASQPGPEPGLHGPPRPASLEPASPDPAGPAIGNGGAPIAPAGGNDSGPVPELSMAATASVPSPPVGPAPGLGPDVVDLVPEVDPLAGTGPARPVTPGAKLRLWAGGDSLGEYVGNQLLAPLSNRDLTTVELDFHIGTGLTRPDTYDWQARIDEIMARPERPEALVFMVGGNDNQPMRAGGQNLAVGSEPWLAEYRARVVDLMDSTRPPDGAAGATHLWWIGLPPMRDGDRDGLARSIDAIIAEEAAGRPWVTFVDLMPRFSGPEGGFAGTVAGPDGRAKVARAPDGIHITYAGSTWIAEDLWAEIAARWGF